MYVEVAGIHYQPEEKLKRYVTKRLARLEKFVPRHARKSVRAEVRLTELKSKTDKNQCEITLHLPDHFIAAKEVTMNMFSSVDVVEAKLESQLRKYKAQHGGEHRDRGGRLRKILRRKPRLEV